MNARVLLIEEDDSVQKSLCKALCSEGCTVLATTVTELGGRFPTEGADVVVMDADTPTRNGWILAAQAAAALHGRPLVLLTAEPGQLRRALAAGASVLLEKPIALPTLLETIERLLTKATPDSDPTVSPTEPKV